jgi:cysteine-rich repeat protein
VKNPLINRPFVFAAWIAAVFLSGCLESNTHKCAWGTICPAGTICEPHTEQCVDPNLPVCGNGQKETGEQCDDGNGSNDDACLDGPNGGCRNAFCGDGFLQTNVEECDDANNIDWDGCSDCAITAFQINGSTEIPPHVPSSMAMDSEGRFVTVWTGTRKDSAGSQIWARRFDATGMPLDDEFCVDESTIGALGDVAVAADGRFVIVWHGQQTVEDTSDIWVRLFDAQGNANGASFVVNTDTAYEQRTPQVAMSPEGDFVVTWRDQDESGPRFVKARLFDSTGTPQSAEIVVNSETTIAENWLSDFNGPAVAMGIDGRFAVSWCLPGGAVSPDTVFVKRYDPHGTPAESVVQLSFPHQHKASEPGISMGADDRFVVVWRYEGSETQNASIRAQLFLADGQPSGDPFSIDTTIDSEQRSAVVTMAPTGDFVVSWQQSDTVYFRRFAADGSPLGEARTAHMEHGDLAHECPGIDTTGDGRFVIVWNKLLTDIFKADLVGQRFDASGTALGVLPIE